MEDSIPLRILIVMICFVTACSVLQTRRLLQTDSLSKVSRSVKADSDQHSSTTALRIYDHRDSSDRRSYAEIFPDGNFKYSDQEGFSGQARRIFIAGRSNEQKRLQGIETLGHTQRLKTSVTVKENALMKRKVKEKTAKPGRFIPLYIVGCLLVYAGIYLFRNRLMSSQAGFR